MKNNNTLALILAFVACLMTLTGQTYAPPANLSPKDIAEWAIAGGFIAAGAGEPTITVDIPAGALYVDTTTADAPNLYRFDGTAWRLISGGASQHSQLDGLDFATSGHTGFASTAQIPTNASFTLSGLAEKSYNSLSDKPTSANWTLAGLLEKNFSSLTGKPTTLAGYGITDAATVASVTAVTNDLSAHEADTTDPHGAEMTVTDTLTIGTGALTVDTYAEDEGVYVIQASDTKLLGRLKVMDVSQYADNAAAIAGGLATGTVYRTGDTLKIVW